MQYRNTIPSTMYYVPRYTGYVPGYTGVCTGVYWGYVPGVLGVCTGVYWGMYQGVLGLYVDRTRRYECYAMRHLKINKHHRRL